MKNLTLALRSFFKKGNSNIIKIITLGTGLAVGLILLAKVSFERNFDDFYPDAGRIYQVWSAMESRESGPQEWGQVSGAIAPGMKAEIPEIEAATRFTWLAWDDAVFSDNDKNRYKASFIMADSCFFDVLPRPMIAGNAKEILSRPLYAMVSESVAKKMGGNVVNRQIELESRPGKIITIGGVFKDVPENSHARYDIIVSLSSLPNFSWDGRENWLGNERYMAYVKLRPNVQRENLYPAMRKMQEKYQDIERLEKENNFSMKYLLLPLTSLHSDSPDAKRLILLLSIIAFALIITAVLNYILIVITALVGRSKEIAVYKCYGATEKDVTKLMFTETLLHFFLSLLLAVLLVTCFRGMITDLLSASLGALFNLRSSLFLLIVCVFIFLVAAIVPSYILSRIPVATVFRNFTQSRRGWKLVLLFVQFVAASFLFLLLVVVSRQYQVMINDNPGYTYQNTMYMNAFGVPKAKVQAMVDELSQLPQVTTVATASNLPFNSMSGNNISLPGGNEDLFNIADMYRADENYFPLMEIPVIEGSGFDKNSTMNDILVSKSFKEKMKTLVGWDEVVGKDVKVSEHGLCRIVGVFPDIRLGSISNQDMRPSVLLYAETPASTLLVKLNTMNSENIKSVYEVLKTALPEREVVLSPYSENMVKMYSGEKRFRNAITIGGIITILITLIGLIGYINNEIVRRTSEIAVRKINGATLTDILRLFVKDILYIAPLAIIIGGITAVVISNKWMENFSEKVSISPLLIALCGLIILLFIELIVVINCLKIANQNPVDSLKNE